MKNFRIFHNETVVFAPNFCVSQNIILLAAQRIELLKVFLHYEEVFYKIGSSLRTYKRFKQGVDPMA